MEAMNLYLFVRNGTRGDFQAAIGLAATAAALGREAHLYLTYEALFAWCRTNIDDLPVQHTDPSVQELVENAVERGTVSELSQLWDSAREAGTVRIYACSTSAQVLRLEPEELTKVDAVMGHATFMKMADSGHLMMI